MKRKPSPESPLLPTHDQCGRVQERYNIGFHGKPIMGRCPYARYAFLLSEQVKCAYFKPRKTREL